MSLIGDALKKAHIEAVRQDGSSSRLVHTPGVAQYRRNPEGRKSWTTVLVVSNVILALVIASVIVWGVTRGEAQAPQTANISDAPATPVTAPAAESPPRIPEATTKPAEPTQAEAQPATAIESNAPAVKETTRAPVEAASPSPVTTAEAKPVTVPAPSPVKTAEAKPVTAPAPIEPAAQPRSRNGYIDGQTYMRSIPVPGGAELVLNGMSVAGGKGVALINSRMVREGDRVGPFQVGSIRDRRVELSYDGITIYLKLP